MLYKYTFIFYYLYYWPLTHRWAGILFLNAVFEIQCVGLLLQAMFIAPSTAIKAHAYDEMHYFTSVFTTTRLHGLHAIYYKLAVTLRCQVLVLLG